MNEYDRLKKMKEDIEDQKRFKTLSEGRVLTEDECNNLLDAWETDKTKLAPIRNLIINLLKTIKHLRCRVRRDKSDAAWLVLWFALSAFAFAIAAWSLSIRFRYPELTETQLFLKMIGLD